MLHVYPTSRDWTGSGFPTYGAVVPKSQDLLSIYNGKGSTKGSCRMWRAYGGDRAAFRLEPAASMCCGVGREMNVRGAAVDPANLDIRPHEQYIPDLPLQWVEGFDIAQQQTVMVPARLAGCMLGPEFGPPVSELDTSNGLASGNTLEEAICHAL